MVRPLHFLFFIFYILIQCKNRLKIKLRGLICYCVCLGCEYKLAFSSSSRFSIICESHMVPAKKKLIFLLRLAYCPTSQVMFAGPTLMFLVKKTRYSKLFVDLTLKRINFFSLFGVCLYIYIYIYIYNTLSKPKKKI